MGNEISHRRHWCRRSRRFERLPEEERTDVPDVPTAQGEGSGSSGSPSENDRPQGAAAGLHNKERGRKKETASCSPPVAQGMVRSPELQQPGGAGDSPPATNPAGKTPAASGGRAAGAAEPAGGQHSEVTRRGSPVQPAAEGLRALRSSPDFYQAPRARPCTFCKWLESLKTPEVKRKAKPDAGSSQE